MSETPYFQMRSLKELVLARPRKQIWSRWKKKPAKFEEQVQSLKNKAVSGVSSGVFKRPVAGKKVAPKNKAYTKKYKNTAV